MSDPKSCPIISNKYALIGIGIGIFLTGLGISYAIFLNTYNPISMMQNPQFMQSMIQNPQQMQHNYTGSGIM